MENYTLNNLSLREIKALRKSLDHIPINGIDALFIASLQLKFNEYIKNIEDDIQISSQENIKPTKSPKPS